MAEMNQQTLSLKVEGETIVSRPFDFEALCLMNDIQSQPERGRYSICANALPYLFEGTKVTGDVLSRISTADKVVLCDELWEIYLREMQTIAGKKRKNAFRPAED